MKIFGISTSFLDRKRNDVAAKKQDLTSFGGNAETEAVSEVISKNTAEALKSKYMSNLSFKGHVENIYFETYGTAGQKKIRMDNVDGYMYPWEGNSYSDIIIKQIKKHPLYHENSSIENTGRGGNSVYFAEPEEGVSTQTRNSHNYIVYDNFVDFPSLEDVRENYFNKEVDAKNYGQTFKNIAEFHYRRELADKRELAKLKREKEPIQNEYDLSLEYKQELDEKARNFPWQVDQINKDKEKADYFYSINLDKLNKINEKIGYYTDRINYSKRRQVLAAEAYRIFDEVGLMFLDRDNTRHEIHNREDNLQWYERSINRHNTEIKQHKEELESIEEEMTALKTLQRINNKKLVALEAKSSDISNYAYKSDKQDLEKENAKINYNLNNLQDKQVKIKEKIAYSQKEIAQYQEWSQTNIDLLPGLKEHFENKSKEIQSYYNKMFDFYKNNIEV